MLTPAPAPAHGQGDAAELERRVVRAFDEGEHREARDLLKQLIELDGASPIHRYNLACALAQLGDLEGASDRLIEAISIGFVDFHHMKRDSNLGPMRGHITYESILEGWRDLLDARMEANLESAKRVFGSGYDYEQDEDLRLLYISAFDRRLFQEARRDIEMLSEWAFANLFTGLGPDRPTDRRPDPWVSVILPTPEDFVGMVRSANVGGFYSHNQRRLISQDIGPSLRHEFLHVLHWRDMTRLDQRHPDWILEGLGCLVEDIDWGPDGELLPAPSWRTNIVKRLERAGRMLPLNELMTMPREHFVGRRPNAHYAQARAVMMFLHEEGKLSEWYRRYTAGHDEDDTGIRALESVFETSLAEVERRYRAWIRAFPEAPEEIRPGMASIGVEIGPGRGDGPEIERIPPGSDARRAGLRMRDVITAINGRSTRAMEDLVRILSEFEPGETVEISVRRGRLHHTVQVTLVPAP